MALNVLRKNSKTYCWTQNASCGIIQSLTQQTFINGLYVWASLVAQKIKNLPAMWETRVWSLEKEDPLEKEMATHSSVLPGESHGSRRLVGYSPWGHKESDMTKWLTLSFTPHPRATHNQRFTNLGQYEKKDLGKGTFGALWTHFLVKLVKIFLKII